MNRRRAAEAALIFNTLVWGSTFVLVRTALVDVSPILFIALRFNVSTPSCLNLPRTNREPYQGAWTPYEEVGWRLLERS